jgi:hypothetical protein
MTDILYQVLGGLVWLSDLMFVLWVVVIFRFCRKRGVPSWKAWICASSFWIAQAYFVANVIGYNIGFYALVLPALYLLSPFLHGYQDVLISRLIIYIPPIIIFMIIPAFFLYYKSSFSYSNTED